MPPATKAVVNEPPVKVLRPLTGGFWFDSEVAVKSREGLVAPTTPAPFLYILDLMTVKPTFDVLNRFLVPLAREIRDGVYGRSALVVSATDPSVRHATELLAAQLDLPLWLADSTTALEIVQASPAGTVSETDRETLRAVVDLGARTGAAEVAAELGIQHTAAFNRLASLSSRGYLHRESRSGRAGDLFIHPLVPALDLATKNMVQSLEGVVNAGELGRIRDQLGPGGQSSGSSR
jgi:hypothetical protein